jgi:uncharacterized cupin superfamily protein/mono/diheme cytochrome c family protein
MRHALVSLVLASISLALHAAPADVTYSEDVAPIFLERCGDCHRPGGMAPMALTSYRAARPWARAIRREVASERMPPFHARGADYALQDDISLSRQQIDTVLAWVDQGAAEGDPKAMPPLPDYVARAAAKPAPDLFLEFPGEFSVPPGADLQRAFVIRNTSDRDLWVNGVDYEPDLNPAVHHMFAFTDPTGLGWQYQDQDPEPGFLGSIDGGEGTDRMMAIFVAGGGGFGGWAPGAGITLYGKGIGQLLPAGTDIILQYHYWNGTDEPLTHRPRIGLYLHDGPVERILQFAGPSANQKLAIRPGDTDSTSYGNWTAGEDMLVLGVMPHMHFLGKSMKLTMHEPDGKVSTLVDVPRYDFEWQTVYRYQEPIPIAKGTRVEMVAVHDNSAENPANPHSPPRLTMFGERSDDEMADGTLFIARSRGEGVADTPKLLGADRGLLASAGGAMDAVIHFGAGGEPGFGLTEHELGSGFWYYGEPTADAPSAGVFLEDPMATELEPFPFSEFVYILDGSLRLTDAAGRSREFGPGDAVLVPRGVPVKWEHDEPLHKYFVILDPGDPAQPAGDYDTYLAFDGSGTLPAGRDGARERIYYADAATGSEAGVWEADPVSSDEDRPGRRVAEPVTFPYSELMVILEGSVTIVDEAGREGLVTAGDVVILPKGRAVEWHQSQTLRKFYVSFDAGDSAAASSPTASTGR